MDNTRHLKHGDYLSILRLQSVPTWVLLPILFQSFSYLIKITSQRSPCYCLQTFTNSQIIMREPWFVLKPLSLQSNLCSHKMKFNQRVRKHVATRTQPPTIIKDRITPHTHVSNP